MKKVSFKSINRINDKQIRFTCIDNIEGNIDSYEFYYEFSESNSPSDNALAISFSCLIGKKQYDELYIDLDINYNILNEIQKCNECAVTCRNVLNEFYSYEKKHSIIINFSGGLDSLALINILNKTKTHIISIDFGGSFAREYNFFRTFNPIIVKTNIRESKFFKKLESKSWQFMGLGTVLYAEKLQSAYYTFGTILEADRNFNCNVTPSSLPFSALGLGYISATNGLTEVATTKIACNYHPDLIKDSLQSLSNVGTVKRFRKDLLASIFTNNIHINKVSNFQFGKDYVFDFLLFYFIKIFGFYFISNMIKGIPEDIQTISSTFKLNFYERMNPKTLITFNNYSICDSYLRCMFESGISIYTKDDFYELYAIRNALSKHYHEENKHCLLYNYADSKRH